MTPPPITATVSHPKSIPKRPTMYALAYPLRDRWELGHATGSRSGIESVHKTNPGSVIVIIPGEEEGE